MLRQLKPVHVPLDDVNRFDNARQVSAYIGLVPRQYQSGETDRFGRITKRGSRLLRAMLLECAWVSLQYNPWTRATYDRICGGQKTRKKKAAGTDRRLVGCGSQDRGGRLVDVETRNRLGSPTPVFRLLGCDSAALVRFLF